MIARLRSKLKGLDWVLMAAVSLLAAIGLVEIYSIALSQGGDFLNFQKQIAFIALGAALMLGLALTDQSHWRGLAPYFYLSAAVLLAGLFLFGSVVRGTRGWYQFGILSFQPVEFAKIALLALLARYFAPLAARGKGWGAVLASGGALGLYLALVLAQPDLGSALVLVGVWLAVMFFAGVRMRYFAALAVVFSLVFALSWSYLLKDYQKDRVMTFLDPRADALGQGYNVAQAAIAVGSGGLIGRGVGFGSQSQLRFLPEAQNDFIFAVIGEELGFLGAALVVSLFGLVLWRLLRFARLCADPFGAYILAGAAGLIFIQMFVNIGMNIGLLPVIGISLPFLSYGGSAIVSFLILVGLAQSVIIKIKSKY